MKLIDSYLVGKLLVPMLYCLAAFAMIFVIFDLFEHLSLFLENKAPVSGILLYYFWILPGLLVWIAPISVLLGMLYCLWQLSRCNELTAMRASGVGYRRLMAPLLCVSVFVAAAVLLVNEAAAPETMFRGYQFVERLGTGDDASLRCAMDLQYRNERAHRIWAVKKFDLFSYAMQGAVVSELRADGSDREIIRAEEAEWVDGQWMFFRVEIQAYDEANRPLGPARKFAQLLMGEYDERPRDFLNEVKNPIFFSSSEIRAFLQSHPNLDEHSRLRLLVDMHSRLAMPWASVIVAIFGIPCGLHTGRRGALAGIMSAFAAFFGFYILMTFGTWLGKTGALAPWLAGWLPNIAVFAAALGWMSRIR